MSTEAPRNWDRPIAIGACMCACVAAYGVYLGLPLILGALADAYGFSNREIGWISSAENAGLLLGSISVSVLARSGQFRKLAFAGMVIAVIGNAVTLFIDSFVSFCAVRLVTGLGAGLCYSAAIACLSLTRKATRNFSIFIFVLVLANSLELWVIPSIVAHFGVRGLYTVLGLAYVVPALLLHYIPAKVAALVPPQSAATTSSLSAVPYSLTNLAWSCLLAVVMFNVAASALWAYSERIGTSIGLSEQSVANTLTLANLLSLTGSVVAYWLSRRWGQHRPQLVAMALMIAVYVVWSTGISIPTYVVGVFVFFAVWALVQTYQMGTLAVIDHSGRYVALIPAAQGIGQSVGPFIGGLVLGWKFGFPEMLLTVTLFAVACSGIYAAVYLRLRHIDLKLANT
jgi:predicted MFS family arabinose efflux permease